MGDSSGEEFYSAPESEEEEPSASSSQLETETLKKLTLSENNDSQSGTCAHDKNAPTVEDQVSSNNAKRLEDTTSDKNSEYMSGLDNRLVSDDQEVVEGDKVELTEEQIKELKEKANAVKADGNTHFKNGDYTNALECYSNAIELYPKSVCAHEIAVCYANRAACHMKTDSHQAVIDDCSQTLELEPAYLKALLRRAQASEALEKYEDALNDYKKALEIDPSQGAARQAVLYLPDKIKEQNEKLKEEMIGKLKELGNAVLSPFGLSTNNFQLQQNPETGSYSINFKR